MVTRFCRASVSRTVQCMSVHLLTPVQQKKKKNSFQPMQDKYITENITVLLRVYAQLHSQTKLHSAVPVLVLVLGS